MKKVELNLKQNNLENNLKNLPKIDLHCHLDGSLRNETVLEFIEAEKLDFPTDLEEIKSILIAPSTCTSLMDYLSSFTLPVAVMQTKKHLERVSFELLEDSAKENIKYIEVRFAPQLHTEEGLTFEEIIESVLKGMKRAEEKYDIKGNYILSCMRHLSPESAMEVIEAGRSFLGKGVVAVDLAGGEEKGFCNTFIEPMKKAKEYGYHITIHAGETGFGENIIDAINLLGAERIGHGVSISTDKEAYNLVKEKKIPLEICPTSNVQTRIVDSYKEHPIYEFYKDEIIVTLNTDNRTVSNTNMTRETLELIKAFDLKEEEYKKIYLNSVNSAFLSETEKSILRDKISQ